MTKLPERLRMLVDMLIAGQAAADIGADHALLPLYLVERKIAPKVIIGELGEGPYLRALHAVNAHESSRQYIEVRQGDGLQVLHSAEVSSVVLAGMGGDTMAQILAFDKEKACSFKRYVFQPMTKHEVLRQLLADWGWPVLEERLIKENGHFCLAFSSMPGSEPYEIDLLQKYLGFSADLIDSEAKKDYLKSHLHRYQRIEKSLQDQGEAELRQKAEFYHELVKRLEEIIDGM